MAAMIIPIALITQQLHAGNVLLVGWSRDLLSGAAAFFFAYGLYRVFNPGVAKQPTMS